ncbi:MAG: hypothetical protein WD875_04955 [Pirellulales bacterium]
MSCGRRHGSAAVGRCLLLMLIVAAVAMLMRVPLAAIAEDLPVERPREKNKEQSEAGGLHIDREPLTALDIGGDGDADVATVAEIWRKLRGDGADALEVDKLRDVLRRMKAEGAIVDENSPSAQDDALPRRYGEQEDDVRSSDDTSKFYSHEDEEFVKNLVFASAMHEGWQSEMKHRVTTLRKAARTIDAMAADLDDAGLYRQADGLFQQADSMRSSARSMLDPQAAERDERDNAKYSAADYNLHAMRSQLQLYRTEHAGRYPTVQPDADGKPSLPQLTSNTNEKGDIGTGAEYPLGPYMITLPDNPLSGVEDANAVIEIDHWPPKRAVRYVDGWFYCPNIGQIAPNTPGHLDD